MDQFPAYISALLLGEVSGWEPERGGWVSQGAGWIEEMARRPPWDSHWAIVQDGPGWVPACLGGSIP